MVFVDRKVMDIGTLTEHHRDNVDRRCLSYSIDTKLLDAFQSLSR